MPVENRWIVENRILLTEIIGDITTEELIASSKLGTQIIDSGIAPVYSLVDLTAMGQHPIRLNEFTTIFRQPSSRKLGWIIICGIPNHFASFIATTFAQVLRKQYRVTPTRAEALELIEKIEGRPIA
jgi:hypothetical protein